MFSFFSVQRAIAAAPADSVTAVELKLVSILDGPAFRGSRAAGSSCKFLMEETLAGRQGSLKERTFGIAVLGKRSDYATGADAGVARAPDLALRVRRPSIRRSHRTPAVAYAPTLFAAFLAPMAIRGGVESSDAFSRFWNRAIAGKTEMAGAAMPSSQLVRKRRRRNTA